MWALKRQYLFTFAVTGTLLPFLPAVLDERGLSDAQIGYVTAMWGVAVLISPALLTLLADLRVPYRALLGACFFGSALGLVVMFGVQGFWPHVLAYGAMALCFASLMPLQDGLTFAVQARQRAGQGDALSYHAVRVWGTFGFIIPAVLTPLMFDLGQGTQIALLIAAGVALLGAINTPTLPTHDDPSDPHARRAEGRVPTMAAVRLLLKPRTAGFVLAMWLMGLAVFGYYTFYPLYLTDTIGLDTKWLGIIIALGVSLEVAWMLGLGWLTRKLGFPRVVAICAASVVLRMALMALFPNPWIAIGTQLLHGPMVLAMHVLPPVFLNHGAAAHTRASVQGVYVTAILGTSRVGGLVGGGLIAEHTNLPTVFGVSTAVTLAATGLLIVCTGRHHAVKV